MYREVLIVAITMAATTVNAANFTGDPGLVAVAEKSRITSAMFWTGKKLKDWPQPCPIAWFVDGNGSGDSRFYHKDGTINRPIITANGSREVVSKDTIPHEVDHLVRATIVGHPIPRWLDEGSAIQFESPESRAGCRSSLLRGDLQNSVWDMMHLTEYPRNDDAMTALYSGSASVVEWMLEVRGPKEVLKAQQYSLSTPQQWQLYVGEPLNQSRQRYDEWFQLKYASKSHPAAVLETQVAKSDVPFADVYVAGDFECKPCHQFLEYVAHSRAGRKFHWRIHRISGEECRRNNISVPMFVVNEVQMGSDVAIEVWHDVDVWAAKQLGLGNPHLSAAETLTEQPKATPGIPIPIAKNDDPPTPIEVAPGVSLTPDALAAFSGMLAGESKAEVADPIIDWSVIKAVIALSDANPSINKAVKGPSLRAFRRLTGGTLKITVLCEEDDPGRFDDYSEALGLDIDVFHVSVLVPSGATVASESFVLQKVENLLNATASNFSRESIRDIPVEIISEELDGETYGEVLSILGKPDELVTDHSELIKYLAGPVLGLSFWGALVFFRKKKPAVVPDATTDPTEDKA
jgi:hypothetical protein